MPVVTVKTFNTDIGDQIGFFFKGLAYQLLAEDLPYEAVASSTTDAIVGVHHLSIGQRHSHPIPILCELD